MAASGKAKSLVGAPALTCPKGSHKKTTANVLVFGTILG